MSKPSISIQGGIQASSSPSSSNVSQETRLNTTAKYPQGCPIHIVKFASTTSQPVASSPTSNTDSSRNGPVRRKSTEIIASPPPKEEQIKAPELAKLNIKVRDFAFESTLPPIAPFHRTVYPPVPVQAGPRPLKRPRQDDDPFYDGFSQPVAGPSQPVALGSGRPEGRKSKPLERESTEPADPNQPPLPSRQRGYADLSQYQPASQSQSQSQPTADNSPRTPTRLPPIYTNSQSQNPWTPDYSSQSQPLPQFVFSQESEPYIDTPLVTPNGSLQWPATDIEINSIPESQMDTESQVPAPEILTYSQLGFSPLQSQMDNPSQSRQESISTALPTFRRHSSPLSAPPSSPLPLFSPNASPGPSTELSCPPQSSPSPRSRSPRRPKESVSPSESASLPRYNFRKRHAPPSPPAPSPPAQRTTRLRSRQPPPSSSRPLQFSMQSAHARSKSQSSKDSSRPKSIRKPRSASSPKVDGRRQDDKIIAG
ncbi:hypothetical protein PILCRDRAFT_1375 [Piloderma croceum F 1598]|uniref:Uncharacterized protein n=1 Tax=Piloderma croceum (strain F 1598) TaxID=765440 RepID=A0A0C3BXD4_PILCF|nr:hypothetical protein PILCRDRAFT_1375 [Piloderma croceum F 1598]